MYQITMPKNHNQSFTAGVGGRNLEFDMATFKDMCYLTVVVDGETIVTSAKCTPNSFLFDNKVGAEIGNIAFMCYNGEYPHPDNFNDNSKLVYVTADEFTEALKEYGELNISGYLGNFTKYFG